MTDNPEQEDLVRIPIEGIRALTKRSKARLGARTDDELIGEVDVHGAAHLVNPMELNRRLKVSITELTAEVKAARSSSDKLGKTLVGLTRILVVLTLALVGLTIVLIVLAVNGR